MSLRINRICIDAAGPVKNFYYDLGDLNLIYGKNETGKSFIVDFVIQSLFKNIKKWEGVRRVGNGRVVVSGIDRGDVEFTPHKGKKLEDFLEHDNRNLICNISELLIARAGRVNIKLDKAFLRELISSRKYLDEVCNKIPITIQKACFSVSGIEIDRRGEGERYIELSSRLNKVDEAINRVKDEYNLCYLDELRCKKQKIEQEKERMLKALRYTAYKLHSKLKEIESAVAGISESLLNSLHDKIQEYSNEIQKKDNLDKEYKRIQQNLCQLDKLKEELLLLDKAKRYKACVIFKKMEEIEKRKNAISAERLEELEKEVRDYLYKKKRYQESLAQELEYNRERAQNYLWLKTIKELYLKFSEDKAVPVFIQVLLLCGMIFQILSFICILMGRLFCGEVIALACLFVWLYVMFRIRILKPPVAEEFKSVKEEFRRRFGTDISMVRLEEKLKEYEDCYNKYEIYKKEFESLTGELKIKKDSIEKEFFRFIDYIPDEDRWYDVLVELQNNRDNIEKEYSALKCEFDKLKVSFSQFIYEPQIVEYDEIHEIELISRLENLKETEEELREKEDELKKINEKLQILKSEIILIFSELGIELKLEENRSFLSKAQGALKDLEDKRRTLYMEQERIKGELKGYGVKENEFEKDYPGVEYSKENMEKIDRELQSLGEKIQDEERKFVNLKMYLQSIVDVDASTEWEGLMEALYSKREILLEEIMDVEAKIIAGKIVYDEAKGLMDEQDSRIEEIINSKQTQEILYSMTNRYKNMYFSEEEIYVSDSYNDFLLGDLSSGTIHQIMLALRVSFLMYILKKDRAFLILDDVLQYTDYVRRHAVIDTICKLVDNGWQVIYLTMDDNIRDLFNEHKESFGRRYKEILLDKKEIQISEE